MRWCATCCSTWVLRRSIPSAMRSHVRAGRPRGVARECATGTAPLTARVVSSTVVREHRKARPGMMTRPPGGSRSCGPFRVCAGDHPMSMSRSPWVASLSRRRVALSPACLLVAKLAHAGPSSREVALEFVTRQRPAGHPSTPALAAACRTQTYPMLATRLGADRARRLVQRHRAVMARCDRLSVRVNSQ